MNPGDTNDREDSLLYSLLQDLGEMEDGIFKERQGKELQFRARAKAKKARGIQHSFR